VSAVRARELRRVGTRALLVAGRDLPDVLALHARLRAAPLAGQTEVLAAAETMLVSFVRRADALAAASVLPTLQTGSGRQETPRTVDIDVVYDGEDLDDLAHALGMEPETLVAAHTAAPWRGAFGGFAPGFTYCASETERLWDRDVPRRDSPRTAVPAGSVAVAGRFSAVYPRSSPGGWQLLGRTPAAMWDLSRPFPALVRPGDRVRYRAVRASARLRRPPAAPPADRTPVPATAPALEVEDPGLLTLVEDLGRPGAADLGVPPSGAVDLPSARAANRLVGNPATAAVLETLLGGLVLRARGPLVLALTGADAPGTITGADGTARSAPPRRAVGLDDGETLRLGAPHAGLRTYVAVRGGVEVAAELGSRASDTLSGLGPAPLAAGTRVGIGSTAHLAAVAGAPAPAPARTLPAAGGTSSLRLVLGPREDWIREDWDGGALAVLAGQDWRVSTQADRVGVRLHPGPGGRPLPRRPGELASEGVVTGAVQVPPSGEPVLFLADHPVTGGYPVVGVVVDDDLPLAAQLPPGALVRLVPVDPDTLAPLAAPRA